MAAYAALTSLAQILDQLQKHPLPPISLNKNQIGSLTEIINVLQEFLEGYNSSMGDSEEADPLESRIRDAAYAAEDIIESNIVDNIKLAAASTSFDEDLQQMIEEMDLIKKVAMEITTGKAAVQYHQLQRNVSESVGSTNSSTMVGFDDLLLETMDKLTAGRLDRQVIPIVGMGGIGKTTLARNIYAQPLIKEHFDICAWATISQEYNTKEILCEVLFQAQSENKERLRGMSEDSLGLALYKYLSRRRFLIVMDDMWSIEVWDKIKCFFPDDDNSSRIIVTTRLSELASKLDNGSGPQMKFLDEFSSWDLLCKIVFGEESSCPSELKEIGEDIVKSCKGLPLSIVVVGGLLKKVEHTQECWESIRRNLNSLVNLENDKHCLKILKMSYNHLQSYLKPCFLYTGVFEEDRAIRVSTLIDLWDSEGFLKPISGKSPKASGEEYLKELVDRNLILVDELGSIGNIKYCKIHDLLRDLCLREAEKERFYHVITQDNSNHRGTNSSQRRIVIPRSTSKERVIDVLESLSHTRSIICGDNNEVRLSPNFKLLRIMQTFDRSRLLNYEHFVQNMFEFVNSRYITVGAHSISKFPSSISLCWNLHTLIVDHPYEVAAPVEIWKMHQLRHVRFALGGLYLPEPPNFNNVVHIMENLQTLIGVRSMKLNEEVIKRIPNMEKLQIQYYSAEGGGDYYCLNNLDRLQKVESLCYMDRVTRGESLQKLTFPQWLKKLTLSAWNVDWEDVLGKIGSLPLLQKLTLGRGRFKTGKWETVEGQFPNLKFLSLQLCGGLEYLMMTESSLQFPRLERLHLYGLPKLKEISSEIGEIATLRLILLELCSESAVKSAKQIVEEQQELQGEEQLSFRVRALVRKEEEALQSLATHNFEVQLTNY